MNSKPQSLVYLQRTWWILEDATFHLLWVRVHNSVIRLITWQHHHFEVQILYHSCLDRGQKPQATMQYHAISLLRSCIHYIQYVVLTEEDNGALLDLKRTLYTRHLIKNVMLWSLLSQCVNVIIHRLRNIFLFCHQYSTMEQLLQKSDTTVFTRL